MVARRPLLDTAALDANRAIELESKLPPEKQDSAASLIAARIANRREQWTEARQILEDLEKRFPRDPRVYLVRADTEIGERHNDQAIAALERGLRVLDDVDIRWALADLLIDAGRLDDVWAKQGAAGAPFNWTQPVVTLDTRDKGHISELVRRSYNKGRVGYLEGRLLMARENWTAAKTAFQEALPLLIGIPQLERQTNLLVAACDKALNPNDPEAQTEALTRMVTNDPDAVETLVSIARSLESLGRYDEALATYRTIPRPTNDIRLAMARLMILTAQAQPADRRDWTAATSKIDELKELLGDDFRVVLLEADLLMAQGKTAEARQVIEKARNADPKKLEPWIALMVLAERIRKPGEADPLPALLDAAEKNVGDVVPLRVLRARNLAITGGSSANAKLEALSGGLDKFDEKDRSILLRGLADAYLRAGDTATAMQFWLDQARKQDSATQTGTACNLGPGLRSGPG